MKQLIVNADDFGMTEGVNRGILEAHLKGIVSSTTLLANGEAFGSAVALCRDAPQLGVGVHLNLSEGTPVLPLAAPGTPGRSTLVNRQGRLHLTPGKLFAAIAGRRVLLADVEAELRAQIRKAIEAGIRPTHVDGHMHVHVLPGVSEIVVRLARESGIAAIRCPVERIANFRGDRSPLPGRGEAHLTRNEENRGSAIKRRLISLGVSTAAFRLRWIAKRAGLAYPARFYGIAETGLLAPPAIGQVLRSLPEDSGTTELMCHPGYVDGDLPRVGGDLQAERQSELEALTSPEIIEELRRNDIRLMTYADLGAEKKYRRDADEI